MAYKVIILYQLYMPSYFLGTFTEYPYLVLFSCLHSILLCSRIFIIPIYNKRTLAQIIHTPQ